MKDNMFSLASVAKSLQQILGLFVARNVPIYIQSYILMIFSTIDIKSTHTINYKSEVRNLKSWNRSNSMKMCWNCFSYCSNYLHNKLLVLRQIYFSYYAELLFFGNYSQNSHFFFLVTTLKIHISHSLANSNHRK